MQHAPTMPAPSKAPFALGDDVRLAQLLSARVCHDLVGPVGALGNGVEFINGGVDSDGRDQAMRIIADGARQASARLQYYRAAFGTGGALGESAQLDVIRDLIGEFLFGTKVSLDWAPEEDTLEREETRLLLNLSLLAYETMPRGGVLRIGVGRKGGLQMVAIGEGPMIRMSEARRALLTVGETPDGVVEPSDSPAWLTHKLAASFGAAPHVSIEDGRAVIAVAL